MADVIHSWADMGTGVLQNHFISDEILKVALAEMVVMRHTTMIPAYGKGKGETVNLYHRKKIAVPTTDELDEFTRVPLDVMELGTRAITVTEHGRGIVVTNFNQVMNKFDIQNLAQEALKDQMAESMDNTAGAAFRGSDVKVIFTPTSLTGGSWATTGTPATLALANVTAAHLGIIRDYMASTLIVPMDGDWYKGLFSTKALRGLKNDNVIIGWKQYLREGDLLYKSEVGQVEEIRLIEVKQTGAFPAQAGSASVLGTAVVFGKQAVAQAMAQKPELRATQNYGQDAGRWTAVHWYGIYKLATWWNTASAGEAKIVNISST